MATVLYHYGCTILPRVKPIRLTCTLDDISLDTIFSTVKLLRNIDLSVYEYVKVERESTEGFSMKWHMDDRVLIKLKKECEVDPTDVLIHEDYKVTKRNKDKNLPSYSVIVYQSDYNKDFTCGEFEFVDEIILPKKNKMIFFDSQEVHRVQPVKSGIRKAILYKFYKIT
jgi:hypothetical protein